MPSFSLQKTAFRRAKDGLLQCRLPSFAKVANNSKNPLQIYFKRYKKAFMQQNSHVLNCYWHKAHADGSSANHYLLAGYALGGGYFGDEHAPVGDGYSPATHVETFRHKHLAA